MIVKIDAFDEAIPLNGFNLVESISFHRLPKQQILFLNHHVII